MQSKIDVFLLRAPATRAQSHPVAPFLTFYSFILSSFWDLGRIKIKG